MIILSGDQLYKMDYRKLLKFHIESEADCTVSCVGVNRDDAKEFGLMNLDDTFSIVDFAEKPKEDEVLDRFKATDEVKEKFGLDKDKDRYLASMGIYIFNTDKLLDMLSDQSRSDFGKHVIPDSVKEGLNVKGYVFNEYWEDIGTIKSFFYANLMMAQKMPPFDMYDPEAPIYTNPRYLPSTKLYSCRVASSLIADGCILERADLDNCVIGQRSVINEGVTLKEVVMMGSDEHERLEDLAENEKRGIPGIGIGAYSVIERCIIDKGARIGKNVKIINKNNATDAEHQDWAIREGIVIIKKGVIIPDGTVI
jgi:glucose-1-phosphate adenylyltransferase